MMTKAFNLLNAAIGRVLCFLGSHAWVDLNAHDMKAPLDVRCEDCGLRYVEYRVGKRGD
jgi:hypothetical protein